MNGKRERETLCRIKLHYLYIFSIILSKMEVLLWHLKRIYFLSAISKDKKKVRGGGGGWCITIQKARIITFPVLPSSHIFLYGLFCFYCLHSSPEVKPSVYGITVVAVEVITMYKAKSDEFKFGLSSRISWNVSEGAGDTKGKKIRTENIYWK